MLYVNRKLPRGMKGDLPVVNVRLSKLPLSKNDGRGSQWTARDMKK